MEVDLIVGDCYDVKMLMVGGEEGGNGFYNAPHVPLSRQGHLPAGHTAVHTSPRHHHQAG